MSVILGYIPTDEGEAALDSAIAEARTRGVELIVINSSRGDAYIDKNFLQPEDKGSIEKRLAESGVKHRLLQPANGHDAAAEVLDAAREQAADLIVIGLRKRTAVGKLIMGSTAQRILLQAECPVLAVKSPSR